MIVFSQKCSVRLSRRRRNKAHMANDASSCLMEWLYDASVIHDMLFLASFGFDSDEISWNCDRLTDQLTDRPFYRDACMHQKICSVLFMAITGFYLLEKKQFSLFFKRRRRQTDLRTDQWTDGQTNGWTDTLIEMQGHI